MGTIRDISDWFNLAVTQIDRITIEDKRGGKLKVIFCFKPDCEHTKIEKIWNKEPDEDRLKILIQREIYLIYPNLEVMDKPPEEPDNE
ncbi:MAG TPA: hypothetical protein VKK79_18740 [Candidatus Lokiarchaeia archaeon]|nr:hypothetical protein [Candidatus Lokiarchaeia archaeon]